MSDKCTRCRQYVSDSDRVNVHGRVFCGHYCWHRELADPSRCTACGRGSIQAKRKCRYCLAQEQRFEELRRELTEDMRALVCDLLQLEQ